MPLTGVFPFPDTFKYVENHVQNVGGNFKRFCSDVVQDLFPLSADPEKLEAKTVNPEEKSVIRTDNCTNSEINVVETCSDSVIEQSLASSESTDDVNKPVLLDDNVDELQNTESINEESDSREKDVDDTVDNSLRTGLVSNIPVWDSTSPPRYESEKSSPEEPYRHIFVDRSGFVSDCPNGLLSPRESSAIPAMDGAEERELVSSASHLSLDTIDEGGVKESVGSGMVTVNLHDEVKLVDSCVFVDDTALYAVSRRARKLGSYKKKIRDIFASKKRLASEYEQLAIWYGDTDMDSSPETHNSQVPESCDFDWELL